MREIKFRTWDKLNLVMVDPLTLQHKDGGCTYPNQYIHGEHPLIFSFGTSVLLMQYTGLTDKNGVEIYEGDILKIQVDDSEEIESYITSVRGHGEIDVIHSEYDFTLLKWCDWICLSDVEIIGNIHENPELLESES